jgi:catechol 2,3-dioxygenase-like lactoylglutathione lyase family enzyme
MRMSHIGICVSDWKRSLRFYHDVLGFRYVHELEVKGEPSDTLLRLEGVALRAIYLEREGVRIELLHYDAPGVTGDGEPRAMNRLGLTHLSLRVDDLDAQLAGFASAGVNVLADTRIEIARARTKVVFITDPDGTLIELVQQPGP